VSETGDESERSAIVRCSDCGREVDEEDAQAQRWGYWFIVGELYPYCPECAQRAFRKKRVMPD